MSAIVVYHLQYELLVKDGLPAGFILSSFQLGSVQMLFKRYFWKAAFAKHNTPLQYLFGAGIFVLVVVQALITASSAILIVPQLEWWKYSDPFGVTGGFSYLNAAQPYLWPTNIAGSIMPAACDGTNLFDIPKNCPYSDVVAITMWSEEHSNQFANPNTTAATTANTLRYLSGSLWTDSRGYSAVSTVMNHITRALGDVWFHAIRHETVPIRKIGRPKITVSSPNYTTPIMRPMVQTQCSGPIDITDVDEMYRVTFPADQLKRSSGQSLARSLTEVVNVTISRKFSPAVNFIDLSETAGHPLIGALVGMNYSFARNLSFDRQNAAGLMACTLVAHWVPMNMS